MGKSSQPIQETQIRDTGFLDLGKEALPLTCRKRSKNAPNSAPQDGRMVRSFITPGPKPVGIEGKQTEMTRLSPVARARSQASGGWRDGLRFRASSWSTLTKATSTTRASGFGRIVCR